jgi:hypothetical protein
MIATANDDREITRQEALRSRRVVEPHPRVTAQHSVQRKLYGAGQREAPRRPGDGASENGARRTSPDEVIMQQVHEVIVSRCD